MTTPRNYASFDAQWAALEAGMDDIVAHAPNPPPAPDMTLYSTVYNINVTAYDTDTTSGPGRALGGTLMYPRLQMFFDKHLQPVHDVRPPLPPFSRISMF